MKDSKKLFRQVFETATAHLGQVGFEKRKVGIFTRPLQENIVGWVGLNYAGGENCALEINPVVGVRHNEIESLVARLIGVNSHAYIPATISTNIGYLTPSKKYFAEFFAADVPSDAGVSHMVQLIEQFAVPFMTANADLVTLCETLQSSNLGFPHQNDKRLPVILMLLGRMTEAEDFLNEKLRESENRSDPASEQFRVFVKNLRQHFHIN